MTGQRNNLGGIYHQGLALWITCNGYFWYWQPILKNVEALWKIQFRKQNEIVTPTLDFPTPKIFMHLPQGNVFSPIHSGDSLARRTIEFENPFSRATPLLLLLFLNWGEIRFSFNGHSAAHSFKWERSRSIHKDEVLATNDPSLAQG